MRSFTLFISLKCNAMSVASTQSIIIYLTRPKSSEPSFIAQLFAVFPSISSNDDAMW
jgi:hypothetical protein